MSPIRGFMYAKKQREAGDRHPSVFIMCALAASETTDDDDDKQDPNPTGSAKSAPAIISPAVAGRHVVSAAIIIHVVDTSLLVV